MPLIKRIIASQEISIAMSFLTTYEEQRRRRSQREKTDCNIFKQAMRTLAKSTTADELPSLAEEALELLSTNK